MTGRHTFVLDRFQREAIDALDRGESVLVAAPTGSGKTVVAEHAIRLARRDAKRAFYTTPIKALSNQKYRDLSVEHGAEHVGLLTGDNSINSDAPIVVMTTEVLRNMLYASSSALDDLAFVVLDEVHYLQDAYRGPVWEEVIIHCPPEVRLVCLSATVSNAEQLAGWLETVRGSTALVFEGRRPVQLDNLFLVGDRTSERLHLLPTLVDNSANPECQRFDNEQMGDRYRRGRSRRRYHTPHRIETVDLLDEREMLPAIFFIFSRVACDDAASACVSAGMRLTDAEERSRIRAVVEAHVEGIADDDLTALGYAELLLSLEAGVAAHHAGMVPPFKEAVEACFVEGLVKVVFATETLALGINMPARTVVIEKLTKFTGERHEFLTPGQYTQLTGRAGRRGIDERGNAIVLWSPWVPFADVAALVSSRSFPLTSAFRPTYNMAANLVRRCEPEHAHHLLNLSFAQYQADDEVVRLEAKLSKKTAMLEQLTAEAVCERGDVDQYAALEKAGRAERKRAAREARADVDRDLRALTPGDVVDRGAQAAVVLSVSERRSGNLRVRLMGEGGVSEVLDARDVKQPLRRLGAIDLPSPYAPDDAGFIDAVLGSLRKAELRSEARSGLAGGSSGERLATTTLGTSALSDHPVASCPDRAEHLRALRQRDRVSLEIEGLERSVRGRTESLARQFDRVLGLLESWGYLDGWSLTSRGEALAALFHESDLLVAEALTEGALDDLDPASLAGLVSCFTYEHRSPEPAAAPWFPNAMVRHRFGRIDQLADEINAEEARARLPRTRRPDGAFFHLAHAWAAGQDLDEVLFEEDLSGGDFVRNVKQLIDLLRQVADAAPNAATARSARQAAEQLCRGVVSVSASFEVEASTSPGGEADPRSSVGQPVAKRAGSDPPP